MEILIDAIDHPLVKVAAITMANTGLRVSELCNLTLDDVDIKAQMIKSPSGQRQQRSYRHQF